MNVAAAEEKQASSQTEEQPDDAEKTAPSKASRRGKKRARRKKKAGKQKPSTPEASGRTARPFPASTFQEALVLADAFQKFAAGQQRVRKLTLFEKLGKAPDSGPSRQLITNSSRYGLTKGSYKAEFLELTPEGAVATSDDAAAGDKLQARFELAIKKIAPFNFLYERCKGGKLPSKEFLIDALREEQITGDAASECVDTFIVNTQFLGLLRTIAGAERLITIEHALDELGKPVSPLLTNGQGPKIAAPPSDGDGTATAALGYELVCFYITPIGGEDSEQRKHADFFMEYIITPALKEFSLRLVRADQIGKPGMIGKQVLEHILKARLVIADLSFHNPNVFYELCLRHAARLPTVQIIRASEVVPFDIDQYRTVKIDTKDLYSFLPKLQTYISEISNQVRTVLKDADAVDSPVSMYYPSLRLTYDDQRPKA
jgi:hypothetical protein